MRAAMSKFSMKNRIALRAGAIMLVAATWVVPAQGQTCRPTDAMARAMLEWATYIATGSSAEAVSTRAQLKIPSTTASKVTLVTDAATCLKAVQAYAADGNFSPTNISVYLVKVNTTYVLQDPAATVMGSPPSVVLDSKFKLLSRFSG
jgi:hypothetical protein